MNKLLSGLVLATLISSANAGELKTFPEVYNSLQAGKNIKLVLNFAQCNPPISDIQVFTKPTAVMMRKTYLQFANTPLTTNNPMFPNKPVLENCTYKLTDEDKITITTRIIKLPDYSVLDEHVSTCGLGSGVRIYN